jgi:hypothetical protein
LVSNLVPQIAEQINNGNTPKELAKIVLQMSLNLKEASKKSLKLPYIAISKSSNLKRQTDS